MKLPRDLSGDYLAGKLSQFGYSRLDKIALDLKLRLLKALRVGTLNSILSEIASHLEISKTELLDQLK